MIVAALTSLVFGLERPLPLLFVQAAAVLYLVPSSILALRHRRTYAKPLNGSLLLIPMTIAGFATLQAMRMARADVLLPAVGASLVAVVFGGLAVAIPLILYHDLRLRDVRTADGTDDRSWAPEV